MNSWARSVSPLRFHVFTISLFGPPLAVLVLIRTLSPDAFNCLRLISYQPIQSFRKHVNGLRFPENKWTGTGQSIVVTLTCTRESCLVTANQRKQVTVGIGSSFAGCPSGKKTFLTRVSGPDQKNKKRSENFNCVSSGKKL